MPEGETLRLLADPVWEAGRIHGEPLFFVRAEDAERATARLAYPAARIDRAAAATGEREFREGVDFVLMDDGQTVALPPGSAIPFREHAAMYPTDRGAASIAHLVGDPSTGLLFGNTETFHAAQVAVDYRAAEGADPLPAAPDQSARLPLANAKLRAGEALSIVLLGDSISVGCDASGFADAPPGQPGYGPLLVAALGEAFGSAIDFGNPSVGGKTAAWGLEQAPAAAGSGPDLLLVAFGMNDASLQVPPGDFMAAIRGIIDEARRANPRVEIVLVAGMLSNPDWVAGRHDLHAAYREGLLAEAGPGVAVADVSGIWGELARRKGFASLTGNGVNHPNDFGHRVYAQVLLRTIAGR